MVKWQWFDKRFLLKHLWPIVTWLICVISGLIFAISTNHGYLNIWFSQHYNPVLGRFFSYYTNLGQEWLLVPISLILLIWQKNLTLLMRLSATFILNTLITVTLKFVIFDINRPKVVLEKFNLIFTEGVEIHSYNSFPSGHTSAAFALAMAISFWFDTRSVSFLAISLAILVGISRIYLQQHFMEDVLAGAIIGFISAVLASSLHWESKHHAQ